MLGGETLGLGDQPRRVWPGRPAKPAVRRSHTYYEMMIRAPWPGEWAIGWFGGEHDAEGPIAPVSGSPGTCNALPCPGQGWLSREDRVPSQDGKAPTIKTHPPAGAGEPRRPLLVTWPRCIPPQGGNLEPGGGGSDPALRRLLTRTWPPFGLDDGVQLVRRRCRRGVFRGEGEEGRPRPWAVRATALEGRGVEVAKSRRALPVSEGRALHRHTTTARPEPGCPEAAMADRAGPVISTRQRRGDSAGRMRLEVLPYPATPHQRIVRPGQPRAELARVVRGEGSECVFRQRPGRT